MGSVPAENGSVTHPHCWIIPTVRVTPSPIGRFRRRSGGPVTVPDPRPTATCSDRFRGAGSPELACACGQGPARAAPRIRLVISRPARSTPNAATGGHPPGPLPAVSSRERITLRVRRRGRRAAGYSPARSLMSLFAAVLAASRLARLEVQAFALVSSWCSTSPESTSTSFTCSLMPGASSFL